MLRGKPGLRNVSFSVFILCRYVCGATLVHVLREFDELFVASDLRHGGLLGFSLFDQYVIEAFKLLPKASRKKPWTFLSSKC